MPPTPLSTILPFTEMINMQYQLAQRSIVRLYIVSEIWRRAPPNLRGHGFCITMYANRSSFPLRFLFYTALAFAAVRCTSSSVTFHCSDYTRFERVLGRSSFFAPMSRFTYGPSWLCVPDHGVNVAEARHTHVSWPVKTVC